MNLKPFLGGGSDVGQGEFIQAWSKQDEDYYSNMPPPPPELQHHLSGSESPPPPPLPSSMPPTFTDTLSSLAICSGGSIPEKVKPLSLNLLSENE